MPLGGITFYSYTKDALSALLEGDLPTGYIHSYLTDLGAGAVAVEEHYVDRHYLDEFSFYYSKSFDPPPPHTKRLHFFTSSDENTLRRVFAESVRPNTRRQAAREELQDAYLGFIVVRPLPAARIGRTVLRTYPADGGRRHYDVVRPYRVHLGGLTLTVNSLAFQEQDRGAAVCASTALWSALQKVAAVAGHRTPTPHNVSVAAESPYPANHGLTESTMARAISKLGYIADYFVPAENRKWFRARVTACLESQLPVVLLLERRVSTGAGTVAVGHAITLTGFSEPPNAVDVACPLEGLAPLSMMGGSLEVVYAHDDNLGPHAHYEFLDVPEVNAEAHEKLQIRRGRADGSSAQGWTIDCWDVVGALVPKPEKLRLPIDSLVGSLMYVRPQLELALHGLPLDYRARFASGIDIKAAVAGSPSALVGTEDLLLKTSFPRHVGVLGAHCAGSRLCEIVIDVTEVDRTPGQPSILAIVAPELPIGSLAGAELSLLAQYHKVAAVLAS